MYTIYVNSNHVILVLDCQVEIVQSGRLDLATKWSVWNSRETSDIDIL